MPWTQDMQQQLDDFAATLSEELAQATPEQITEITDRLHSETPKPLDGIQYTYAECLEHPLPFCRCDGCRFYRISNNDFRKAKGLEPIPHGLRS